MLNMLPSVAVDDRADVIFTNAELFSDYASANSFRFKVPYLDNIGIGKLGASMILSASCSVTTLSHFIVIVVFCRAPKQMARIKAKTIIAMMAYQDVFRELPIDELIGDAVHIVSDLLYKKLAIALSGFLKWPLYTGIREFLLKSLQKPLVFGINTRHVLTYCNKFYVVKGDYCL